MNDEFINEFLDNLKEYELDEKFIQSIGDLIDNGEFTEENLINLIEETIDG